MPNRRNPAAGTGGGDGDTSIGGIDQAPRRPLALMRLLVRSELVRRAYLRIVHLMTHRDRDGTEMLSAFMATCWALCLAQPGNYLLVSPRHAPLLSYAPESAWLAFFVVGALWQVSALIGVGLHDQPKKGWLIFRLGGQCVAIGVWLFFGGVMLENGINMGTLTHWGMAGMCLRGLVQSSLFYRESQDYWGLKAASDEGARMPPKPKKPRRKLGGSTAGATHPAPPPGPPAYRWVGIPASWLAGVRDALDDLLSSHGGGGNGGGAVHKRH